MNKNTAHLLYMPLTGLGLYGGHRGKRWLRNRIKIFNQFVLRSLLAQTNRNFILWVSVRHEDRNDPLIVGLKRDLELLRAFPVVFTYAGVCFWDDKYPDAVAYTRLVSSIHGSMGELINVIGEAETVLLTIQPSDDCYHRTAVEEIQQTFINNPDYDAVSYKHGYIMDYLTGRVAEWNPKTNPPFYTIKFKREVFIDPLRHVSFAGFKSHEYLGDNLRLLPLYERGFLVGTHGENISTVFNHPFKGNDVPRTVLENFGIDGAPNLEIDTSLRKKIMRLLPHKVQRKLRFWLGERFYAKLYDWLRS